MPRLLWPNGLTAMPAISSEYGMRYHPIDKVWRLHAGIDEVGWSTVRSPVDGVVTHTAYSGGYGNLVKVREDGTGDEHWLAHNRSFLVGRGARVRAGDPVAIMGTTGASTGVHCHHEVHPASGGTVNPRAYYSNRYTTPTGGGSRPVNPTEPEKPKPRRKRDIMTEAAYTTPNGTIAVQARLGGALTLLDDPYEWGGISLATGAQAQAVSNDKLNGLLGRYGRVPAGLYDTGAEPLLILAPDDGSASRYGALGDRAWPLSNIGELAALQRAGAEVRIIPQDKINAALAWRTV